MSSKLMELIKQKRAEIASKNRAKTVKPPKGTSRWRILPHWNGDPDAAFFQEFGQHFVKDHTGTMQVVYVCVDVTYGRPCEICSSIRTAIGKTDDDATKNILKDAFASKRVLLNAIQIDGPNPTTPVVLELAPGTFDAILAIVMEWGIETLSPESGRDLLIERQGDAKNTKYSVTVAAKSSPLPADTVKKLMNLEEYVAQENAANAQRALAGVASVAGLPPPSGGVLTSASSLAMVDPNEKFDDLPASFNSVLAGELDAIEDAVVEPVVAVKVASAVAVAAAKSVAVSSGDSDIDSLLAELG